MHVAIDDTYGPRTHGQSKYMTGNRRTNVALVFNDDTVLQIRRHIAECLDYVSKLIGSTIDEFHFVEIYNRTNQWSAIKGEQNLAIFDFFAKIYKANLWPVEIQTIDDRTLNADFISKLPKEVDGLDLSERANISLLMLCLRIQDKYSKSGEPLYLLLDEGNGRPNRPFGYQIFKHWPGPYTGRYASSKEPLLQITDFVAYCINRSTVLQLKQNRSEIDNWFLELVSGMSINCADIKKHMLPRNFATSDIDQLHLQDRVEKGIEPS